VRRGQRQKRQRAGGDEWRQSWNCWLVCGRGVRDCGPGSPQRWFCAAGHRGVVAAAASRGRRKPSAPASAILAFGCTPLQAAEGLWLRGIPPPTPPPTVAAEGREAKVMGAEGGGVAWWGLSEGGLRGAGAGGCCPCGCYSVRVLEGFRGWGWGSGWRGARCGSGWRGARWWPSATLRRAPQPSCYSSQVYLSSRAHKPSNLRKGSVAQSPQTEDVGGIRVYGKLITEESLAA
jgi:hypothetical protein